MRLAIGIDQGGTKVDAIIADEKGNILSLANDKGFTDWTGERRELRNKRLKYAAELALKEARLDTCAIDCVAASCNGIDWPYEKDLKVVSIQRDFGISNVIAVNDAIGGMRAGVEIENNNTAVICLGTGSNVAVHAASGEEIVFGYYIRDGLQGGVAIGKRVFELAYEEDIGIKEKTELSKLLKNKTGFDSIKELMMAVTTGRNANERPLSVEYKNYAWIMFEACSRGDAQAQEYIQKYCEELCEYVILGARRLNALNNLKVVCVGGIFDLYKPLVDQCATIIEKRISDAMVVHTKHKPIIGSILLWYDRIYNNCIPDEVLFRFMHQCEEYGI